jgi:DNA-binding NarL/FixJ family response regulator
MRVFLVDDSPEFIEAATRLLEREGWDVIGAATSAREAVAQVRKLSPDVMLVDVDLAGESGFDVVREIADGRHEPPGLILISSHSPEDFADLVAESPAAGFLSKSRLSVAAIRAVLTPRPGAAPA